MSDDTFVRHLPCPSCGSSDANSEYTDGHTHCFGCGHRAYDDGRRPAAPTGGRRVSADFLTGNAQALTKRALDEETCRKFGYLVGTDRTGREVQIANYRDQSGTLVAQKIKTPDKKFAVVGGGKDMPLFGAHLWPSSGRRVVITEGELDAMSVCQAFGLKWPAVSLPNGAQSARRALERSLEWLLGYETIVLAFDMDEAGRKAVDECVDLFPPGRVAVAQLPRKDANEMLQAGETRQLVAALWDAKVYRPDGIVGLGDIRDRVLADAVLGRPYFLESVTKATFGRRPGDLIGFGGGTGCGKSDFLAQQVAYDVLELGIPTGVLFLEQSVGETGRRIAGKRAGKRFHVPDDSWTKAELEENWSALEATNRLFLYDNWGAMDWATVQSRMRYMVSSLGVEHLYLDHLTACAAAEDDEKKALERIMAEMAGMAQSLKCVVHYVSHLTTPEGRSHEEGGRVLSRHFKGSRAIGYWSHAMFGLERDTQSPGTPTVLRCLKDRFTGQANGQTWGLHYDTGTGLLSECPLESSGHGFKDETGGDANADF